ncbi:ABC transporter family substrate-binding protein [Streptomyces sp. SID8379]|uniref:ABC transporter family substrate-binding protein n=1 Tax=unclassified Streptomyces TaxID=2593676 RepID=UPI0003600DA0|nr:MULTISPECIES: ABC transporter family substrate-binding protein [unclassified Streptomyces]MYW70495.1 ABC transporter family substrate-binding protein [Streptomyces sp. SID8379]
MRAPSSTVAKGLTLAAGLTLVLTACSGSSGDGDNDSNGGSAGLSSCSSQGKANTCNSGERKSGGTFTYTIEKNIQAWNIEDSNGNTFENSEAMTAVLPQVFVPQPDFGLKLNTDFVTSAEQTGASPQTFVYKINPKASWNDGTPMTADDFIFLWRTMNGKDCPPPPASDESQTKGCLPWSTSGWDRIKSMTGSDGGKTVTVVMDKPYSDWKSFFGGGYGLYPAHVAEKAAGVAAGGADKLTATQLTQGWQYFMKTPPSEYATGGPYRMTEWKDNDHATFEPDPKWYGKSKPTLDRLIYKVISDATQEPTALKNNEVQAIYPQPQVDLVNQIKDIPNVSYTIGSGLQWEHFDLNLHNPVIGKYKALRQAMFTSVSVKDMIDKTVGQFDKDVKQLGSHMLMPGQLGYEDAVTPTGQGSGDVAKAKKLLTDARFTGVGSALKTPDGKAVGPFNCRYTTGNAIRQSECQILQSALGDLGIKMTIKPIGAADLGTVLTGHQYDIIVFAWVQGPTPTSNAQGTWSTGQASNYGGYSNKRVDKLLNDSVGQTDNAKAMTLLADADMIMTDDAYVLPLYQKPTFLAVQDRFVGIRNNPTIIGPPYNVAEWGLRK